MTTRPLRSDTAVWMQLTLAMLGSGVLSAALTHWFNRRRTKAETTDITVKTALALEERAVSRYNAALDALDAAQAALAVAREELKQQEQYILDLHQIIERAGISLDRRRPAPRPV